MANATLTLSDQTVIEGTADVQGEYIRFTPSSEIETGTLEAGAVGNIEINEKQEQVKLESAGPAYINGTGTLITLRRTRPSA